jgi:hypothetical protein
MTNAVNLSAFASNTGLALPTWTTGTRPASPINGQAGFNTTENAIEAYSTSTSTWINSAYSGINITSDTSTATALYPTFTNATTGAVLSLSVTNTKLTFVPSTGTLTVPNVEASNGMIVNSATVSTSYSIPVGSNAIAAGPITVSGGATVTIPSGSRWVVL